ncbi:MAG: ATP-dependent helicase [Acidimicrobiales bacterium]
MTDDRTIHQDLLASLDEQQRLCVTEPSPALCIVAPAGSGKTTVLTRRIAYRVMTRAAQASRILAISYTRAAAYQLKRRTEELLDGQSIQSGTLHSIALQSLKRYWAYRGMRVPSVLERKESLIALAVAETGASRSSPDQSESLPGSQQSVRAAMEIIGLAQAAGLTPETLTESDRIRFLLDRVDPSAIRSIFVRYEQLKRERNLLDFDDILSSCATALAEDEQFAAGERFLYRELYVDEFQDMSPAQVHVLLGYLGERDRVTIVGDPRQAIYGFSGSDPNLMGEMRSNFPDMKMIQLTKNYRCTPEILVSANSLLRELPNDLVGSPGSATRPTQPSSRPQIFAAEDELEETTIAIRHIKEQLYRGVSPRAIAALARTHHVLQPLRVALHRASIPYHTSESTDLSTADAARTALQEITYSQHPQSLSELRDILESHLDGSAPHTVSLEAIHRLHEAVARARREDSTLTLSEFVELYEAGAFDTVARSQGITLSTFHRAKGLQWHHVHLLGVEDGLVPHSHARTAAALAEERRLLYVAMTRATNSLVITHAESRVFNARSQRRRRSPFLDALSPTEPLQAHREQDLGTTLTAIEETLGGTRELRTLRRYQALERWRIQASRAARVSPTSVLDTKALRKLSLYDSLKDEEELARRIDQESVRSSRHRRELLHLLMELDHEEYDLSDTYRAQNH